MSAGVAQAANVGPDLECISDPRAGDFSPSAKSGAICEMSEYLTCPEARICDTGKHPRQSLPGRRFPLALFHAVKLRPIPLEVRPFAKAIVRDHDSRDLVG